MMEQTNVLIVEDDNTSRLLLEKLVVSLGYAPITATNGKEGLKQLQTHRNISAVLLDWLMPEMNGIELLRIMKKDTAYSQIPVIMQTTRTKKENILEGISNGAYYYLPKPYKMQALQAVLRGAIEEHERNVELQKRAAAFETRVDDFIVQGVIRFRTIEEGNRISAWLARFSANEYTSAGLIELFTNAVEHGNLGITYDQKTQLLLDSDLDEEIDRRLTLPENCGKFVEVRFARDMDQMNVHVIDQGPGFDCTKYLDFDPERAFDPHGRGIALSNNKFFSGVTYLGTGNDVEIEFPLQEPLDATPPHQTCVELSVSN
ncbi:MAG: response regulator [Phycisphaeraceae bacterium]|nr:response regulator [Phycisphaeraceae bacterium]